MDEKQVIKYLQSQEWILSEKHPTIPHWYIIKTDGEFFDVISFIFEKGFCDSFFRKKIFCVSDDTWLYFIDPIDNIDRIKRKKI